MPTTSTPQTNNAVLAEQAANLFLQAFGDHPGFRLAHAKGIVCEGTFEGTPEAKELSRASHFSSKPVPVIVRFSNAWVCPRFPMAIRTPTPKACPSHLSCRAEKSRTSWPMARTDFLLEHRPISLAFSAVYWPLDRTLQNQLRSSNFSQRIPTRRDSFLHPIRNRPASPLIPTSEIIALFS